MGTEPRRRERRLHPTVVVRHARLKGNDVSGPVTGLVLIVSAECRLLKTARSDRRGKKWSPPDRQFELASIMSASRRIGFEEKK